jgi:hypothetical protein
LGNWAQPDLDHLARLMGPVVEHPEEGAIARRDTVERWNWDKAARIAIEHIRDLLATYPPPAEASS